MTATSRWVRYPVSGASYISSALVGQRGYIRGTDAIGDTFTIPGASANQIQVNIDTGGYNEITLASGTNLDARFVAKDMQRKLQAFSAVNDGFKYCNVEFSNLRSGDGTGHFVFFSGSADASSTVAIQAGSSDARATLGLSTTAAETGNVYHTDYSRTLATGNNASYTGSTTVSGNATGGLYGGLLDEEYQVTISDAQMLSVSAGGGNTYAGTVSVTGDYNHDTACSYTVTIDATGGKEVMNAGTGSVPTFTVNDTGGLNDDVATGQEMLYSDYYYYVGTKGAKLKWTDAQFGNGDTFTITATPASAGAGAVGVATYTWTSNRGDNSTSASTTQTTYGNVGTKGVVMAWSDSGTLTAKDSWRVICRAPTPEAYGVTSMNYGNVTVTTRSAVKIHQFEIMSGATVLTNVKFSLQNHGTFSHHDAGDGDTEFHFGTVGAGYPADGAGGAHTGAEWYSGVEASAIGVDKTLGATGSPTYIAATKQDLAVVSDADNAEVVGNVDLTSDAVLTAVKLGANETGANSGIVYRMYFDYS